MEDGSKNFVIINTYHSDIRVGIASRLQAGQSGSRIPPGARGYSLFKNIQAGSGAHPASCSVRTVVLCWGLERPGCKLDHSPPSSAKVTNEQSYASIPVTHIRVAGRGFTFVYLRNFSCFQFHSALKDTLHCELLNCELPSLHTQK
jgi:hypothetical protein